MRTYVSENAREQAPMLLGAAQNHIWRGAVGVNAKLRDQRARAALTSRDVSSDESAAMLQKLAATQADAGTALKPKDASINASEAMLQKLAATQADAANELSGARSSSMLLSDSLLVDLRSRLHIADARTRVNPALFAERRRTQELSKRKSSDLQINFELGNGSPNGGPDTGSTSVTASEQVEINFEDRHSNSLIQCGSGMHSRFCDVHKNYASKTIQSHEAYLQLDAFRLWQVALFDHRALRSKAIAELLKIELLASEKTATVERCRADSIQNGTCLRMILDLAGVHLREDASSFHTDFAHALANTCDIAEDRVSILSVREQVFVEIDFVIREIDSANTPRSWDVMNSIRTQLSDKISCCAFLKLLSGHDQAMIISLSSLVPTAHELMSNVAIGDSQLSQLAMEDIDDHVQTRKHNRDLLVNPTSSENDFTSRPDYWGVKVSDLVEFYANIKEDLKEYCRQHWLHVDGAGQCVHVCKKGDQCEFGDHHHVSFTHEVEGATREDLRPLLPNMHVVVARYVKPQTKGTGLSYALMKYTAGLKITAFITHTWDEKFGDFVKTLQAAQEPDDAVWVCSFALDQNANIQEVIGGELINSPFAVALMRASRQVVLMDKELRVPKRSWCAYELAIAGQFGVPTFLWPHPRSNMEKLRSEIDLLDVREAGASKPEDQLKIRDAIENSDGGFEKLNARLRSIMHITVKFYLDATQRVAGLNRMIENAQREADVTKAEVLKHARNQEIRRMEKVGAAHQRELHLESRCNGLETEVTQLRQALNAVMTKKTKTKYRCRLQEVLCHCVKFKH